MYGGGPVFGKMRTQCDQEYAFKMETIENILVDFQYLLQLQREYPYLPITYDRRKHTRAFLVNQRPEILDQLQKELSDYINRLTNLNEQIKQAANYIRMTKAPETVLRRIRSNLNDYEFNLVRDALISMGLYTPPAPKQPAGTNFVYDAGIDHYADGRTKSRMKGRKSAPYSYVNPNFSQPAPEGPIPSYQSHSAGTKLSKS